MVCLLLCTSTNSLHHDCAKTACICTAGVCGIVHLLPGESGRAVCTGRRDWRRRVGTALGAGWRIGVVQDWISFIYAYDDTPLA